MKHYDKYYVLDTNIILNDAKSIIPLSQKSNNLIIIPETVLDEIDSKKSGWEEINFQAREFARMLGEAEVCKSVNKGHIKIVSMRLNNGLDIDLQIVSKENYKTKIKNVAQNIYNDRKILEIAKDYNDDLKITNLHKEIIFLSLDGMARVRAISLSLKTEALVGEKEKVNKTGELVLHKELTFSEDYRDQDIDNKDISIFDKEYEDNNFSYTFNYPSGKQHFIIIKNKKISIVDFQKINDQTVKPKNLEQKILSSALLDNFFQIVISDSPAGSGKTLLTLSAGISLIKDDAFDKIIYIRNSIESLDKGEDIGYLPGLETKFAIYNHPLMDSIEHIAKAELHRSNENRKGSAKLTLSPQVIQEKVDDIKKSCRIETMWVGEMRGRTLSNAFVIIDEAQNMSQKTLLTVLSRLDKDCKAIVLGSMKQIDNIYINKSTNGLNALLNSTKEYYPDLNIFACKLSKVLRGPITEWAEKILSK